MFQRSRPWLAVTLMLGAALALLWGPISNETATTDETVFLGAGYSYWQGHRYYLNPEHPPLMQLWSALPLTLLDVNPPSNVGGFFDEQVYWRSAVDWEYDLRPRAGAAAPPDGYYHYPAVEAGLFGRALLYEGNNDADNLLFWGRFMQALVMLATGLLVFFWAKSLSNVGGGLLALAVWCFNPLALAYGHLIITDPGIALMLPLAVWMFSRFLEAPRPRTAVIAGLAFGGALLTKYTAIILIPTFGLLSAIAVWRARKSFHEGSMKRAFGFLCLFLIVAWGTVLLFYLPQWAPPPPISIEDAARLKVPAWFLTFRPLLIPRDFFKGFAILLVHVYSGHEAYLMGQWSDKGWWYYYPVAILVKTPVALLLVIGSAVLMALRRVKQWTFAEATPLLAAAVYFACAITNKADIGIRHVLPIYPLLAVVVGVEYAKSRLSIRFAALFLATWLAVTAFMARADYIAYFNEFVGGPAHGQNYLVDSNFDWGQNGKLLKQWMAKNHVGHVYLDYFGTGMAIDHLHISCDRVKAAEVRELRDGYVVISATRLMTEDYDWLRATHPPTARIGNTLFVYSLPAR